MKTSWLCIGLLLGFGMLAQAAAQQEVQVPSLDQADGAAIVLPGFWFPLRSAESAPAMVLLHGCGGAYIRKGTLGLRYRELAGQLNALGVQVLVTDSLTPRKERELCTQRNGLRAVTQINRRRDALGALQWLAAQPGVDKTRLGLLGWSNGGSTVLAASNRSQREVLASQTRPSLAVAFYPGCQSELARGYQPVAPLLLLIGEADDWTPAEPCKQLASQASSGSVQIEVYPEAHHGFDSSSAVRLRSDVPNGLRPGQGVHVAVRPRPEPLQQRRWKNSCASSGCSIDQALAGLSSVTLKGVKAPLAAVAPVHTRPTHRTGCCRYRS